MFLALQSSPFKYELSENANATEMELDQINPDDFQNFLELLHGESSIDDTTFEGILHLAVIYDAPTALHRCKDFLREKSKKSLGEKLELSAIYFLEDLKEKYMSEIKTRGDLNSIINYNLKHLNAPILRNLLRKTITICRPDLKIRNLGAVLGFFNFGIFGNFFGASRKKLRNFDNDESGCSDVTILVGGHKFYLSKMFLAQQSPFFKTLLLGNFSESSQSEVELDEIDPNDFQCFLELLHGESSIDDSTVEGILKLADMYDSKTALRRCEQFLIDESHVSIGKKLEFCSKYKLEDLKQFCLSKVYYFDDLHPIVHYNLEQLDKPILTALLEKSIHFYSPLSYRY